MQCLSVAGVLFLVATLALGAPSSKDGRRHASLNPRDITHNPMRPIALHRESRTGKKPRVLFTCPPEGLCYASPRNCFDNCNAAFSMWSQNGTTTYNITMMSPLSFTAVLIKEQFSEKYDKAIICSFHTPRGIVARVNYPDPIVVQPVWNFLEVI
ncbi:hypothetical protein GCK32_010733 [Trichostrongylus colubriformis]|uniref:Uncharacterized protein n=1 Tax=Trichostrongylus colubriformis TaxID=6319 RepID=A0AAN8ILH6_TRICO